MINPSVAAWGPSGSGSRWGHYAPHVLIAAIVAMTVSAVLPPPPGSPLLALAPLLLLVVVLATWVQMRRHDRSLCEHCVRAMPINPSLDAERFRRRLSLAHLGSRRGVVAAYLVVLLGSDVAIALAPAEVQPVATVLWAAIQTSLVYLVLSHVTHRRLQPWCPECGGGGGRGDRDGEHDPTPSGSLTR